MCEGRSWQSTSAILNLIKERERKDRILIKRLKED